VRSPEGGDSGEWVTQPERSPPSTTGPDCLAFCVFVNSPG
jgi:hypothetical protein